ncbi:predicted N-formylglutamate amidohydrolase [Rhizobium subbaraonis]|uniref:Predicted N-formylglutamate amidohydrolase n=1 Tax=Rhizobium subbaraonis TaxID=908946 RepID=A0A285UX53_9HYPH|nr:N-formylglutamate amidohydrolase [Rhizobium subbaraonis]SOC46399.1 predicted N-formylglutamate amidohydrolase [Rhizobium subbaraonis]
MPSIAERDTTKLLLAGDPEPVERVNLQGGSAIFLTCEHAGRAVPSALGDLGVASDEMDRHIAYDVGAEGLAHALSERLGSALVLQRYSRLVIDCNRPFEADDCVVLRSDGTRVPANADLGESDRLRRYAEIHEPLHEAIKVALDERQAAGRPTVLVSVHSFTPVMRSTGAVRDFELGLLYNRDGRFARHLAEAFAAANPDSSVRLNEPYVVDDQSDYTIPVHGERRGLPHVLIEVRNDLITDARGQQEWADRLAEPLRRAADMLKETTYGR